MTLGELRQLEADAMLVALRHRDMRLVRAIALTSLGVLGEGASGGTVEARVAGTANRDPDAPSPSFRPDFKKGGR